MKKNVEIHLQENENNIFTQRIPSNRMPWKKESKLNNNNMKYVNNMKKCCMKKNQKKKN